VEAYLERKSRRSDATKLTYSKAELAFAKCFGVESADIVVSRIKARKLDAYEALDKFVGYLLGNGSAPKTVLTYTSAIKGLLRFEDITVDSQKLRDKVELPPKVEVSIDRIPTREEMRSIILNSDRRTRALIALLATSGLRAGEAVSLRTGNLELLTNKVSLMSIRTKTKRSRYTFFSDETAQFLREYLGERLNQRNGWVFPDKAQPDQHTSADAAYMDVYRVLKKLGLKEKLDPDSKRNELHPHSFRKYFFSKLIGAGVDRGIAEFFMGHRFGLDSAYLHMPEESFKAQYMKAVDDFTFLHDRKLDRESKERVDELQNLLKRKEAELRVTNERLEKLESRSTATPEDIREEVRRILKEQGPELLKQLGKA
jgi:integrase